MPKPLGSGWRRFHGADGGVVAVEIAMLAVPFFLLLMGTVEMALGFAATFMMEGGVAEAARVVRTGEAADAPDPEQAFRDRLCAQVAFLIPCAAIQYEVVRLSGFGSATDYAPQFDEDGNLISGGFDLGGASDVMLVRVFYRYQFLTPFIAGLVPAGGDAGGNTMALMSTAVIRNEPYTFGG